MIACGATLQSQDLTTQQSLDYAMSLRNQNSVREKDAEPAMGCAASTLQIQAKHLQPLLKPETEPLNHQMPPYRLQGTPGQL